MSGHITLLAPTLLLYEITNGVKNAVVRERIPLAKATDLIDEFLKLSILLAHVDLAGVLTIAVKRNLSVYDASYVWLAREKGIPFLTLDAKLEKLA